MLNNSKVILGVIAGTVSLLASLLTVYENKFVWSGLCYFGICLDNERCFENFSKNEHKDLCLQGVYSTSVVEGIRVDPNSVTKPNATQKHCAEFYQNSPNEQSGLAYAVASQANGQFDAALQTLMTLTERGSIRARGYLGEQLFFKDVFHSERKKTGIKLILSAAKMNDSAALYNVYRLFYNGFCFPYHEFDPEKGTVKHFEKINKMIEYENKLFGVEISDISKINTGSCVQPNLELAIEALLRSHKSNYLQATYRISRLGPWIIKKKNQDRRECKISSDLSRRLDTEAIVSQKIVAELKGRSEPEARMIYARKLRKDKKWDDAVEIYTDLGSRSYPPAVYELAKCRDRFAWKEYGEWSWYTKPDRDKFKQSCPAEKNDREAASLYLSISDHHSGAMSAIGFDFCRGGQIFDGVTPEKCISTYNKAIRWGSSGALTNLADYYSKMGPSNLGEKNRGSKQEAVALNYYRKRADIGGYWAVRRMTNIQMDDIERLKYLKLASNRCLSNWKTRRVKELFCSFQEGSEEWADGKFVKHSNDIKCSEVLCAMYRRLEKSAKNDEEKKQLKLRLNEYSCQR